MPSADYRARKGGIWQQLTEMLWGQKELRRRAVTYELAVKVTANAFQAVQIRGLDDAELKA